MAYGSKRLLTADLSLLQPGTPGVNTRQVGGSAGMLHGLSTALSTRLFIAGSAMASPAHPATLQEQAICAAQAELSFKKNGYKKDDPGDTSLEYDSSFMSSLRCS